MSNYWQDLAGRLNNVYVAEEFESAAYRLVTEQVIYHADRNGRTAYDIVSFYEREFTKVLSPLGVTITVNRALRYAVGIPQHARTSTASVAQTLFALVLRGLYEEVFRTGGQNDHGEVVIGFVDLQERYRLMTGRDLPTKGDLDALIRTAKRWGILRRIDEEDTPNMPTQYMGTGDGIVIRPAIADVLGESALTQLALWAPSNGVVNEENEQTPEDE
jgi:hypothetical protein